VAYPQRPPDADAENTLLIYSVKRGNGSRVRLISAFPVTADMVRRLRAAARDRGEVEIRLRYNAYVPGLYGRSLRGRRYVAAPLAQN